MINTYCKQHWRIQLVTTLAGCDDVHEFNNDDFRMLIDSNCDGMGTMPPTQ